jgi:hypothetical protein
MTTGLLWPYCVTRPPVSDGWTKSCGLTAEGTSKSPGGNALSFGGGSAQAAISSTRFRDALNRKSASDVLGSARCKPAR